MSIQPASQEPFGTQLVRDFESEARLDEEYIVLTVAAGLIATLGLLANSSAVVIGAMLIAPWILPLRAVAFAILQGELQLVLTALLTLAVGDARANHGKVFALVVALATFAASLMLSAGHDYASPAMRFIHKRLELFGRAKT